MIANCAPRVDMVRVLPCPTTGAQVLARQGSGLLLVLRVLLNVRACVCVLISLSPSLSVCVRMCDYTFYVSVCLSLKLTPIRRSPLSPSPLLPCMRVSAGISCEFNLSGKKRGCTQDMTPHEPLH